MHLVLVSPRRIADLGRALGHGVRDFRLEFDRDERDEELPGEEHDEKPMRMR